ncbi:beta-ketoacyl synthase N-terminal-like domain-containing protein [Streptomyces griseocarneus]|uniref:beta-ketoacyl synthase N-terminal-like domain-containing protein n=1 Tax=Streptomyces griseocarneus TaxID=51201 RepID=UPI00167D06AF|nr:beta-ketoacyl synthase N-terminal-like domain-containing protein [Streptomyces griseocarneus]MBZ6476175.1 3-oxoacyl-ACP synthase [Streptomyces griseocarneus]GHG63577.1 3-oxoacyl-ACP synthase [Streptomyces griseocarneus]
MNGPTQTWRIAGTGAVTSLGTGTAVTFDALCAGRGGPVPLRAFDTSRMRTRHAFEIPGPPREPADRLCQAVAEALGQAGLPADLTDVPVLVGSGLRGLRAAERRWAERGRLDVADLSFGRALRDRFGAVDTHTFGGACSASLYALALAADLLAAGDADTVVAAGVDTITASMYGLLDRAQPQSPREVRPFDRARSGQLLGEGAAAVVLRRGGPARAVLRSVALHCDARHVTAPDVDGLVGTQTRAHEQAGIKASDVDLVHAQGTGSLVNDRAEALALARVFGTGGESPLIISVEAMTGHTSGCSGLLATVIATECLRTGRVPPAVGLSDPIDEATGLRFATGGPVGGHAPVTAQIDAFGFGGVNAVAILGKAL